MPIQQQQNITKNGIEDFEIRLFVPGPTNTEGVESAELTYQILLSDGSIEPAPPEDLLARLTDDPAGLVHLANLASMRNYVRTRLNAEALPTP